MAFLNTLDNGVNINSVAKLIATHLLGDKEYPKICLRYRDMFDNFDSLTYDEWDKASPSKIWHFSSGVTPFHDFDDTPNVPITISSPAVKTISDHAVTSLDLPIWFIPRIIDYRVMILSQDPMPRSEWYDECRDAVCSTPFGLHWKSWREKGNGGARIWGLVQKLLSFNVALYLTDIRKFHFRTVESKTPIHEIQTIATSYKSMLLEEINLVSPQLIITLGTQSASALSKFREIKSDIQILNLPHFSGQAQGKIKEYFGIDGKSHPDIKTQIELYSKAILNRILQ